jgi:hypothetical protein
MWDGWRSRLQSSPSALAWLKRRGLRPGFLGYTDRALAGSSYGAIAVPTQQEGERAAAFRFYPEEPVVRGKMRKSDPLHGWRAGWVPDLPATPVVVLLAGLLDAVLARQKGMRYAVSTTCGATLPSHLLLELAGRSVAIAYDVGEESQAERTAAKVRSAGAEAWVVPLGLPVAGDDLTDWFVKYGRSRDEFVAVVRRARRASR